MSFLDKARPTQKQPIQKQPTNTGLSFASKIKPKVNTIDIQKTKLQAQGLPVSVNKNRVDPTIGGGIVRGLAKIPVKIGLTIPAAFRGEKGVTLKSQYLGDTSDFAKTINEKADKLANRVNKGEISLGRALGGAVLNAATETADIASVVPVGGLGVTAAKNVVGAIAPKLAKPVVQTLGKSLGTSALRGGGTAALYDVGQQINEGDKYNLGQTLQAAGMGTALDVGLSTALPKAITKGKQFAGERFTQAGRQSATVNKITEELKNVENNYAKLRKNQKFSSDANSETRKRIATSGLLNDAVDETGTIRTANAVKKYKDTYLAEAEGVVRNNLERLGEKMNLKSLEKDLTDAVYRTGFEGNDLRNALNNVKKEISGYRLKADVDGNIPLTLVHDAKVSTYKNIDFNTPAEVKTYRKAIAEGLKNSVEKNTSFNAKDVNSELSRRLKDISYLESLDGRKVKGGKLGKYFAQISGQVVGGGVGGAIGGLPGMAVGSVIGGELSSGLKGRSLANTFSGDVPGVLPKSKILEKAVAIGKSPRLALPAPRDEFRSVVGSGPVIKLPGATPQSIADEAYSKSLGNRKTTYNTSPNTSKKLNITKTTPEPKVKSSGFIATAIENLKDPKKRQGGFVQAFKNEGDLTTKILKDLEGKTTVSKQYILDATNRPELKQVERDLIRDLVNKEGNTVNVADFAQKVKAELLPLKVKTTSNPKGSDPKFFREQTRGDAQYGGARMQPRYEMVNLPDELRGNVKNYRENIYESPIKTSAGETHFGGKTDSYFGHTRIEDMADNKTRRVIEVQSDLYQKGNLEREVADKFDPAKTSLPKEKADKLFNYTKRLSGQGENLSTKEISEYRKLFDEAKTLHENTVVASRNKELSKLQQYNDPTAHFRMIREEIKKASQDGKTKLQFPTGETAMKIEGLGHNVRWTGNTGRSVFSDLTPDNMKVGMEAFDGNSDWIITDVLGDGKFKAVQAKDVYEGNPSFGNKSSVRELPDGRKYTNVGEESFDISGKVDTNNPIYKFYEKDVQKYLNKFGGKKVVDNKGVSWIEIPITKEQGKSPVEAFGNIQLGPLFAIGGASAVGVAGLATYYKGKEKKKVSLPKKK